MTFSDLQLKAYLAGDLPADLAAELEVQIAHDDALETRLLAFDHEQFEAVRTVFDAVPDEARIQSLEAMLTSSVAPVKVERNWGKILSLAAVLAFGAVVLGGLLQNQTSSNETWREQVAIYQALYVTETLASLEPDRVTVASQLEKSSTALGRPLSLDVVGDLDGLDLLRAQVLGFDGLPLVQMAYLTETGVPVALCAVKFSTGADETLHSDVLAGLPVVSWSDDTYSYMIVGDIEPARLARMANAVKLLL